ncbi:cell division protein SepF [Corynebacterium kroppenstedtii]|uniref:cell division protein SepF n=1 Tax=Corynebacterium sp. PCR 32 TaxID=3351342 RepID=UPI003095B335
MAGSMDKVKEFFGLQPVEDYKRDSYYEDEYEDYGDYDDRPVEREHHVDSYSRDGYSYRSGGTYSGSRYYSSAAPEPRLPESDDVHEPEIVRITLAEFRQARQIGEAFRNGDIVVYDVSALEKSQAQRVADFAAGIQIALDGKTEQLTTRKFALVPKDVTLDDEQREQL